MGPGLETLMGFLSLGHCLAVPLVSQFLSKTWCQVACSLSMPQSWDLVSIHFQCLRQGSCQKHFFSFLTKVTYIAVAEMFLIPITQNALLPG